MRRSPRLAALLVAVVAFLAYVPVLGGTFLDLDDDRFVRHNPAVHQLDVTQAIRYFTDGKTLSPEHWWGTWRPLRTLDFAIDWAISGGRPWFFHLRNVLYHVLASLLILLLCRRLLGAPGEISPEAGRAALFGALLFAVHPVQTESVAWITSRGDGLLLVTFLSALLLHLKGRRVAAALVLMLALFSKEGAVVFPVVALLADRFRREPLRFRWYGLYALLVGIYAILWIQVQAGGDLSSGGHHSVWWGGTYGANLLTMSRGFLLYAGLMVLPVHLTLDYYVPATTGFDLGAALGILLVLGVALAAWRGGRRVRFGICWFGITLLPVMNVLYTVGHATAERFLYLPMVGFCFLVGHWFARTRLAWSVLACLFLLTLARSWQWADFDRLMAATRAETLTQVGQMNLACLELDAAHAAFDRGDSEGMRRHAMRVVEAADELFEEYRIRVDRVPSGLILVKKSNALLLMERYEEALSAALRSIELGGGVYAHFNAADALIRLGRPEEAARQFELAHEGGFDDFDLRMEIALLLNLAARKRVAAGEREAARALYRRSLQILPDPVRNADAFEGLAKIRR